MWATILMLEAIESDFLACRSVIGQPEAQPESAASVAAKQRQANYKELQKERNKKYQRDRKNAFSTEVTLSAHPQEVDEALTYFSENGFELKDNLQLGALGEARKTLARVFHPDRGGTHEEILNLNENYNIVAHYLG